MPLVQHLRRVASDVMQHEPVRAPARYAGAAMLEVRGVVSERFGRERPLRNVYGAGIQKAGSQWAKQLFDHELVISRTGLATFPQVVFGGQGFRKRFPAHCYVPGIYFPYPEYAAIKKQKPYRTFYVARDPRDVVVSWYFSVRDTHRLGGPIADLRQELRARSISEGLLFAMDWLEPQLNGMTTWIGVTEPEVAFFRLEDIRDRPEEEIGRLLKHCEVELSDDELAQVARDTSRDELRRRDLDQRASGEESHYRRTPSRHDELFEEVHYEAFRRTTGDLVERLGYPS